MKRKIGVKEKMEPEVTIVILGYCEYKIFVECCKSIEQNTTIPYKLICVSNNAEEKIQNYIMQKFAMRDNHKVIWNNENVGVSRAYNQAVELVDTKYICLINSDYIMQKDWLANLKKCFEHKPNIGLVSCFTDITGNEKEKIQNSSQLPNMWIKTDLGISMYFTTKEIYDSVWGWDEQYKQLLLDIDFNEKILHKGLEIWTAGNVFCQHKHVIKEKLKDGRKQDYWYSREHFKQKWGEEIVKKYKWA